MSGICITRWMNRRTYCSSYQTRTRQDLFIFIQKVFYCHLFTQRCEFITNHHQLHRKCKGKMCFSKQLKWLDDGIFPRSIVKKLAFNFMSYSWNWQLYNLYTCGDVKLHVLLFVYYIYCLRPESSKINAILYKSSAREFVTSSHATRLTWWV